MFVPSGCLVSEILEQDPSAFQESCAAVRKLEEMEQQFQNTTKKLTKNYFIYFFY